jgi:hypothetical protein
MREQGFQVKGGRALSIFTRKLAGFAAMAGLAVAPVQASIPPSIAVDVISSDRHAQATMRGLVEIISAYDNFQRADSHLGAPVRDCLGKPDMEACARAAVRAVPVRPNAPPALVIVTPGENNVYRLTCIGAGEKASKPEAQSITIDMKEAMFAAPEVRFPLQHKALGCIWSAAAEAGGIIKD